MADLELFHVRAPMAVPFTHPAAHRQRSDSVVLRLTADGVTGIGECAPRMYVTGETAASVRDQIATIGLRTLSDLLSTDDPIALLGDLGDVGIEALLDRTLTNNARCLVETAVLDLLARRCDLRIAPALDHVLGTASAVASQLPITQVLDLSLDVSEFLSTRGPFHTVKVKASADNSADVRTVRVIAGALGPSIPIIVDANMSWSLADAVHHCEVLRSAGAHLVEEPLPKQSLDDLRVLRAETGMPIMLDESVCDVAEGRRAIDAQACDVINVRVAKCGGLVESSQLVDLARARGVGFYLGVQVAEVGPLITAGRALAFRNADALSVEAGQSDRFFPTPLVAPAPAVDRVTNIVTPHPGIGWGCTLTDELTAYRWEWELADD